MWAKARDLLKNEITTGWDLEEKYVSQMKIEMLDVISCL